jgi:SH3 domain protein
MIGILTRLVILACLTGVTAAYAQTVRYVTDDLTIPLRSGKSLEYRIIAYLPSGSKLELLETDSDSGYSRVSTDKGSEGWVQTRYLSDTRSAKDQLEDANKKVANLQIENNRLSDELKKNKGEKTDLGSQLQSMTDENRRLNQQLTSIRQTAANALAIDSENKTLQSKVVNMERETQSLEQENAVLKDRRNRDWFIAGALVLGGGILLGLVIPKLRVRRKSNWDTL